GGGGVQVAEHGRTERLIGDDGDVIDSLDHRDDAVGGGGGGGLGARVGAADGGAGAVDPAGRGGRGRRGVLCPRGAVGETGQHLNLCAGVEFVVDVEDVVRRIGRIEEFGQSCGVVRAAADRQHIGVGLQELVVEDVGHGVAGRIGGDVVEDQCG